MKKRRKKILLWGASVAFCIIFAGFIVGMVWKIRLAVVLSDSMNPEIAAGSVVVLDKKASYEEIEGGDVIAFEISTGQQVIHRVVEKNKNGLLTKGDANQLPDGKLVQKEHFNGKVLFTIPKAGYWLEIVQSAIAYLSDTELVSREISNGGVYVEFIQTAEKSNDSFKSGNGIEVALENKGVNNCYVRVRAALRNGDVAQQVQIEWDEQEIVYCREDGYYYYESLLRAGERTQEVVRICTKDKEAGREIFLYGEACQSAGYQKEAKQWIEFEDYKEAWEYAKQNAK